MGKLKSIVVWLLVALLAASLFLNVRYGTFNNVGMVNDTTNITIIDTIPYYLPTPTKEIAVNKTTAKLPIATSGNIDDENIPNILNQDSIDVVVPITQKKYEDSTYTAYVSGYNPNLDSIFIYPRHDVITITKIVNEKRKRWNVGIQVGYGITFNGTLVLFPYIGVGISYNLFSF